jgi:hypothetical protein
MEQIPWSGRRDSFRADAVTAMIEVKSTLTPSELRDALDLLSPPWWINWRYAAESSLTGLPHRVPAVPFRAVFAYTDTHHDATITTEVALGVRSAVPPQVREAFNASGTLHLLSMAGFYMAAVYGAVFFLLRGLIKQVRFRLLGHASGWPHPTNLAATCALLVVMGYACLVTLDGLVDLVDPNFPRSRN